VEVQSSDTGDLARRLRVTLDRLPGPAFAVLDGAHFDDLEDELADAGIASRSLFLRGGDEAMRRYGPWLVDLTDGTVRALVEQLALEKPCAVFWSCPDGEQALWQHLRTINYVLIPNEYTSATEAKGGAYERVMFRHWDPRVLVDVLPLLDAPQFARVFGAAQGIVVNASDHGGLKYAPRPNDLPLPPRRGPLKFHADQLAALSRQQVEQSNLEIAGYLREVLPPPLAEGIGQDMESLVRRARKTGRELGIATLPGHKRWAYLMAMTQGRAAETKEATDFIRYGGVSPDEQVKALIGNAATALRGRTAS